MGIRGSEEMKVFVICSKGLAERGLQYTHKLEYEGHKVFFPLRDTKQVHTTANAVVHSNLRGIEDVDEVHILWDGSSYGSIFDLGMAYALRKRIKVIYVPSRMWYTHLKNNLGGYLK